MKSSIIHLAFSLLCAASAGGACFLAAHNMEQTASLNRELDDYRKQVQKLKERSDSDCSSLIDADSFLFRRAVGRIISEYVEEQKMLETAGRLEQWRDAPAQSSEHYYGSADAEIVLYVFSDLSCPHCASMFPVLKDYADRSGGSVALVFRHFPLRMHGSRAVEQALFAECIARIGGNREFWFAIGELFSAESERAVAGSLNLDFTRISDCIRDRETAANVVRDVAEGEKLNISSTPAVVVLDRIHNVRITLENISSAGDITAAVSRIKTGLDHPTAVAE